MVFIGNGLFGQLCGGKINFQILTGKLHGPVQFESPRLEQKKAVTIPDSPVRFSLKATGEGTLWRIASNGFDFMMLDYGCSQEMHLQITNLQTRQKMRIHFINLCDTQFGMDIPFRRGKFEVNVCKRLAELKASGKQCNTGWDISADLTKR